MRDYYAVLGVEAGATAVQIRRAYQRLARRYSPDVNFWERETRALFEEIAEAYRILSNPTARTVYDRQGARTIEPRAGRTNRRAPGRRRARPGRAVVPASGGGSRGGRPRRPAVIVRRLRGDRRRAGGRAERVLALRRTRNGLA